MLVIVSVSKANNGGIQVGVARPQHGSKPVQSYLSTKEAREVLLGFGIAIEAADLFLLELVPQLSDHHELKFPAMDVPQYELRSRGFEM